MPSIILRKISNPEQLSNKDLLNLSTPLTYQKWLENHMAVIPNEAQKQYEKYLLNFYSNKTETNKAKVSKLKNDYTTLIKKLSTIFKNDVEFEKYSKINFDSNIELKIAIPYFAKKLKELAIYYINNRNNIKDKKIQYASVGSESGLERFLYKNLLNLFTNKNVPNSLNINTTESLSAISKDFNVELVELYDTTNYFTEALDINPLYCVLENYTSSICSQFNDLTLDAVDGVLESLYLCEGDNINETDLIRAGWEKYLGSNLYYLSGGFFEYDKKRVALDLQVGNNFFYWFSGTNANDIPEGIFESIAISAIDWSASTASSHYSASDLLFISYGNLRTEAAWLMSANQITFSTELTATITNGRRFKFPYPGIGLSAEGGSWTGELLTDTFEEDRRFFPNEVSYQDNQKTIEQLYWTNTTYPSAISPISVQDLTLWRDGAFASNKFKSADKIIVRANEDIDGEPITTKNIAWLYQFNQTQIPIKDGLNTIYYPLTSFENIDDLNFEYLHGDSVALSAVPTNESFPGAVAGEAIEVSDIIIRLKSECGPEVEAAWLQGPSLRNLQGIFTTTFECDTKEISQYYTSWQYTSGAIQPSLSFKANPGELIKFVWSGPNTNLNEIKGLCGFDHDDTCEYKKQNHNKSLLNANFLEYGNFEMFEKWRKCSCKSVYYSPLGHRSDNLILKDVIPDIIIENIADDIDFNFADWVGVDGKDYTGSTNVARFIPNELIEKEIGWGKGRWRRNTGEDFEFKTGNIYTFYRADFESCNFQLPAFIVNHAYPVMPLKGAGCADITNIPQWTKAVKNSAGEWIDAGVASNMQLRPGHFYNYIHRTENNIERQKLLVDGVDITPISGNYVNLYDNGNLSYKVASFVTPTTNFLIKISLQNTQPYWGRASYENNYYTHDKLAFRNTEDNRETYEYLLLNQPIPSPITLHTNDVFEYELSDCGSCFTWKQPLTMLMNESTLRWNKIEIDECVQSDILNYLHEKGNNTCYSHQTPCYSDCQDFNICGCANLCEPVKVGVNATNIPSDIVLNTELSGVPLYVNYFSRNNFTLNLELNDITFGKTYIPTISGLLVEADSPWKNLLNDKNASFAHTPIHDNLLSRKELGIFTPNRLAVGKYELHNSDYETVSSVAHINAIRENYYDYPITPFRVDSSWMKNEDGFPVLKGRQSFHPYANDYNNIIQLSGNFIEWQNDIFSNQYILSTPTYDIYSKKILSPFKLADFHVQTPDNNLIEGHVFLSNVFKKYQNIFFGTSGINIDNIITTENGMWLNTEDGMILVIG